MKKSTMTFLLLVVCSPLFAQERLEGEPELLMNFAVGDKGTQLHYYADQDGVHTPGSPFIDGKGRVLLFRGGDFVAFENKRVYSIPYRGDLNYDLLEGRRFFLSQQGMLVDYDRQLVFHQDSLLKYDLGDKEIFNEGPGYYTFPAPFGALVYSSEMKQGFGISFDMKNPKKEFSVVLNDQLAEWLVKQPGGFSIGSDSLLYRNGVLWSANKPVSDTYTNWRYLGRLPSGHSIWTSGDPSEARIFTITTPDGAIELSIRNPGAEVFTYGLGPWGEFYSLLAPTRNKTLNPLNDYYEPEPGETAKLVVIRNHLKYFGRLKDGGVRLRKEPTTTGDILGTYPNKTGFRILDKGSAEETIGDQKNIWYKVRLLDGKVGWFFGSFVQQLYDGPTGKAPPWPNVPDW